MNKALIITGAFFLLCSCMNTRKLADTLNSPRIHFGKRGGFTNIPLEYVLTGKGLLYKLENDSLLKIRKVPSNQLEYITGLIASTSFSTLNIDEHGNITYFIRVVTKDYDNEVNWYDPSEMQGIEMIYKALMKTTAKEEE